MLKAGLAEGDDQRLIAAADSYDTQFGQFANRAAWAPLANRAGFLPSGSWYPDARG
jgi:hypothetical protein